MTQIAKTQIAGVTDDPVENAQEITDDDDSDEDDSDEESAETREVERLRVLQAAGLKIQNHLTRGTQKRRPPPPLPRLPTSYLNGLSHKGRTSPATASKDAAASTNGEMQGVVPTDDAYARWQALKGESSALARTASAGAASGVEIAGTKDGGGFVENTSPDLHAEAAATFSAGQVSGLTVG